MSSLLSLLVSVGNRQRLCRRVSRCITLDYRCASPYRTTIAVWLPSCLSDCCFYCALLNLFLLHQRACW